jgi:hypothetical protein
MNQITPLEVIKQRGLADKAKKAEKEAKETEERKKQQEQAEEERFNQRAKGLLVVDAVVGLELTDPAINTDKLFSRLDQLRRIVFDLESFSPMHQMQLMSLMGATVDKVMKNVTVTYKTHECCKCHKKGSNKYEAMKAHSEVMEEVVKEKNFAFLIDDKASQEFAQKLRDKVGILLLQVNGKYFCQECLLKGGMHGPRS